MPHFSTKEHNTSLYYRPEIDGLRTLAVFAVIFYHAKFSFFSGGFIGVDVFFVISGFLITSIIIRSLMQGAFSFIDFYERRIRRIAPALYVVIIFTYILSFFVLLPGDFKTFAKSLQWLLCFGSNIFFSDTINYFTPTGENFPLLHTWSLSLEEQFYFIFPAVLLIAYKINKNYIFPLLSTALLINFFSVHILNFISVTPNETKQFFLIFFRAWELLAGALCALCYTSPPIATIRQSNTHANILSFIGLSCIFYGFCFLDNTTNPSDYAPIPIIGTCLILLFCHPKENITFVGYLLSTKTFIFFGLISYSLYLWHHPIFAFTRMYFGEVSSAKYSLLIILSCFMASVSYKYIEKPLRNKDFLSRKKLFVTFLISTAILWTIAMATPITQFTFMQTRYPSPIKQDLFTSHKERTNYVITAYNSLENTIPSKKHPLLVIIGDSYSEDFTNMIIEAGLFKNWEIKTTYYSADCQINFDDDRFDFINKKVAHFCREPHFNVGYLAKITEQADVLIFAASWREWSAKRIATTIDKVKEAEVNTKSHREIFILNTKQWKPFIPTQKLLNMSVNELKNLQIPYSAHATNILNILQMQGGYTIIDPLDTLKDEKTGQIPYTTPEGYIISHDGGHLTQRGAKFIGEQLAKKSPLAKFALPHPK